MDEIKDDVKVEKVPEAVAVLRYSRISNSKVNAVAKLIRNMDALEAIDLLQFTNKEAARILKKVLESAIANAVNNHHMTDSKLYIHKIDVCGGPILKRIRPRAKGSANRINKRTSHIRIILRERD